MAKDTLIAELVSQRETVLQACWAHQLWAPGRLATKDGQRLEVIFQGWLNKGAGPDFHDARIRIGDDEHFGDVEVHMREGGWREHGHQRNARYNRVMLHVVLGKDEGPAAATLGERVLPVFEVLPHLTPQALELLGDAEAMLRQYERLPGRCGLRAAQGAPEAVGRVIAHAAEYRARQKAERLLPDWNRKPEEELLFQLVFQSLGYRPYAQPFRELAARFPLGSLAHLLNRPYEEARREVLSRWFGAVGLLGPPGENADSGSEEARAWRTRWRELGEPHIEREFTRGVSRPWNSPERRMVGMFHHLFATGQHGWLKWWLEFLQELDTLRQQKNLRKAAVEMLRCAFGTPEEEPWRRMVAISGATLQREARLIGDDRIIIVMANAVLPFFLAYARRRKDEELEKLLYRLFIVLPPEGPNARTRFMERRMMVLSSLPRTMRMQQGLLQIHQDFCTSFYEGCENCGLPELMAAQAR